MNADEVDHLLGDRLGEDTGSTSWSSGAEIIFFAPFRVVNGIFSVFLVLGDLGV